MWLTKSEWLQYILVFLLWMGLAISMISVGLYQLIITHKKFKRELRELNELKGKRS
jgi:hypothetical protein